MTFLSGLYSLLYLARSFTNFFRNHEYQELANMNSFLDYEKELLKSSSESEAQQIFKQHLDAEIANCQTINFAINIKRTEDIARSKKGIFLSIILTLVFALTYIIFNYIEMSKKEESKKEEPKQITKMETKPIGPKSVKITCHVKSKDDKKKRN